jgi:4-amino-4-deoxy-L-arabinose transferase-like glycosyltransferase
MVDAASSLFRSRPGVLARPTALIVALALALMVGSAIRVWVLRMPLGAYDSDEAIWTLMARHVLDGELPVYFWGQGYGGTLEVYLAAPFVWLFGGGIVGARVLMLLLDLAATALVWLVGRRVLDGERALIAAALFWMWPAYEIWRATRIQGFYVSGQILGLLVIYLVIRLAERPTRRDAFALGVVCGLVAWQTLQVLPILLAALAWLGWRRPAAFRMAWIGLVGAVLAALPAIVVNVRNGWWFHWLAPGNGTYESRLRGFFTAVLPQALGVRTPFSLDWPATAPVGVAVTVAAVVGACWLLVRHREDEVGLLALVALTFPFIYALSPYTWLVTEPRYAFVLAPVIALLVAQPLAQPLRAAAALVVIAVLSLVGTHAIAGGDGVNMRNGQLVMRPDLTPILKALDERGITRAVSEYWLSYRVILATHERVILNDAKDPHRAAYRRDVARAGPFLPSVYITGSESEQAARPQLERNGYRRETFGGFSLWTHR